MPSTRAAAVATSEMSSLLSPPLRTRPPLFIPEVPLLARVTRRTGHSNRTVRRPRAAPPSYPGPRSSRLPSRAVFLPPEGVPSVPDDDVDEDGHLGATDAASDDTASTAPTPAASSRYSSSIDEILSDMPPSPDYDTWASRNATRSLQTFRRDDPFASLGYEELNESLQPDHLQRHRHVLAPDEAFAAIFTWDVVVANARELERASWQKVADEQGLVAPDIDDIVRAEMMAPESAVNRVFYWRLDWEGVKHVVFRKEEIAAELEPQFEWRSAVGIQAFLASLSRHGVKCILCAARPRCAVEPVVQALGLSAFFSKNEIVSGDDEFDSLEQMFLVSALKCERPPGKCVIFTDKPSGITAGHDISSKVVALVGAHAAYDMKTADHVIKDYEDLVVYNIRRLFSEGGPQFMEPQTEVETETV